MSRNIILSLWIITELSGGEHHYSLSQNPLEIGGNNPSITAHEREKKLGGKSNQG